MNTINIMNTYNRKPIVFESGEGIWLFDDKGNKYMDFVSGVAVNCLGHSHPELVSAMSSQVGQLIHVSNLYWTEEQLSLGTKLCDLSGLSSVFFCNSGTETLEAALKISKKFGSEKYKEKNKVVVMENAFHGRTMGALSLTWNEKYKKPFGQLLDGVIQTPLNDIEKLESVMDEDVCAIILEPIQGEGGIYNADKAYMTAARDLADKYDALLIFDEVQCGIGRTGYMFAYEMFDVKPDVLCLAKGLGAGMPIGAVVVGPRADVLSPGDHGSTFGGNPLACKAGNVVLDIVGEDSFLASLKQVSDHIISKLKALDEKYEYLVDIRGAGLMLGIETKYKSADIVEAALSQNLLLIGAGENTVRIIPPLILTKDEADEFIDKFEKIISAQI